MRIRHWIGLVDRAHLAADLDAVAVGQPHVDERRRRASPRGCGPAPPRRCRPRRRPRCRRCASSSSRTPRRTISWSSSKNTRIVIASPVAAARGYSARSSVSGAHAAHIRRNRRRPRCDPDLDVDRDDSVGRRHDRIQIHLRDLGDLVGEASDAQDEVLERGHVDWPAVPGSRTAAANRASDRTRSCASASVTAPVQRAVGEQLGGDASEAEQHERRRTTDRG